MKYQFKSKYGIAKMKASKDYIEATDEMRDEVSNGCGASGWKVDIVPDSIWFLSILEACRIHDWDYEFGQTWEDKKKADKRFHFNMNALINAKKNQWKWMKKRRKGLATVYYLAVKYGGSNAYAEDKDLD